MFFYIDILFSNLYYFLYHSFLFKYTYTKASI